MRGRSSPKQITKTDMEIDKIDDKQKEEPQLSGAYIRSLVKQLTSSRTKDPLNPKLDHESNADGQGLSWSSNKNLAKDGVGGVGGGGEGQQSQPPPQQPQQHKKQVRRRLHTTRPYQERLLNMAEARREIVTALKFHRAAMKQANEQQQQQQQQQQQLQQQQSQMEVDAQRQGKSKSRRNQRIYATNNANNFPNHAENFSSSGVSYPPCYNPYTWPVSPVALPLVQENLNFALPNQTLGLNLNFHDFNNLDTSLYQTINNPSIYSSSSSPSTSSSTPISLATEEVNNGAPMVVDAAEVNNGGNLGLHQVMDDKEIAEIRSIGEQHEMEWNDTLNLVTSAWWFKYLKAMELGPEENKTEDNYGFFPFDEVMEFPSWLNQNESCLQQHVLDYYSDDYFQDPALPCMDIGEIEGIDGEWLA